MTTTTAMTAATTTTALELAALAAASDDVALRERIEVVRLTMASFTPKDIERLTGKTPSTQRSIWQRWMREGIDGLRDRRRSSFASSPDMEAALRKALAGPAPDGAPAWTVAAVRRWLQQRYDRRVSRHRAQQLFDACKPW